MRGAHGAADLVLAGWSLGPYWLPGTVLIWGVLPLRTPAVLPPRFRLASPKRNQTCGGPGGLGAPLRVTRQITLQLPRLGWSD